MLDCYSTRRPKAFRMDAVAPEAPHTAFRDLLFGDVPLEQWAGDGTAPPWSFFRQASVCLAVEDVVGARRALSAVLSQQGLESRHYLQAWDALRRLGDKPPAAEAKRVLGVVIDMPVSGGWDTLAAYEDGSCRYLNFSGAATVCEAGDRQISAQIDQLMLPARVIVAQIGPWDGARPPLTAGHARLSFLCPSGLHFGQGEISQIMAAGKAVDALLGAGIGLIELLAARDA
jgi:hypothetical protein